MSGGKPGILDNGEAAIVGETVGELDFALSPRHLPVKPSAVEGKSRSRVHGTDGAMDVQIFGVSMNDRHAPVSAESQFL